MPSHAAPKLSPFDVGHNQSRLEKTTNSNQRQRLNANDTIQDHAANRGSNHNSEGGASGDEEQDGEDSDGAQADADQDEDEEDDHDPDVKAPSDSPTKKFGRQTGHINIVTESQSVCEEEGQGYKVTAFANNQQRGSAIESNSQANNGDLSSDDEAYNGVDQISDSEKDGSDMDCFEEQAIIDSTPSLEQALSSPMVSDQAAELIEASSSESSEDTWEGFDFGDSHLNHDQDFFDHDQDFFREQFERTEMSGFPGDSESLSNGLFGDGNLPLDDDLDLPMFPQQRRVRFADPILLEDDFACAQGSGTGNGLSIQAPSALKSSVDSSHWKGNSQKQEDVVGGGTDDESGSSSGYETDYGETTDEDDFPASATARPSALVRRSSASQAPGNTPTPSKPVGKNLAQRIGPRIGTWCIDPTKPIAILDSCGKKILVCPARRPKKPDKVFEHILGSGSTSVNTSPLIQKPHPVRNLESDLEQSEASSQGLTSPLFGNIPKSNFGFGHPGFNSTDLYAAAPVDDNEIFSDEIIGNSFEEEDDNDPEAGIRIEDLIDFGEGADDSETDLILEDSRPSSSAKLDSIEASQSSTQSLLDHLDNTVITAFRQTQCPAPVSLSPLSPLKKRKLSPPESGLRKRRLVA